MGIKRRIVSIAAAIWISAGLTGAAHAEPLRIFYSIWLGYGPLFVAQEKGFFAREGVEVELINNEVHAAAFGGLFSGQVDAIAGALLDAPAFSEPDEPVVCALVMDDSQGADGVVASKDIQSIADLQGKSVAVLRGGVPQFYLNVLLKESGLSEAVITTADLLRARQAEFRSFGRAWDAAVDYIGAHPDEANQIIARHLGGSLEDPAVVGESLRGIHFYDGEENRAYFGTPENPGQVYETMQHIIDVWSGLGRVKVDISPADVIAHDVWE